MWFENLVTFIELGFRHILPLGLDHILFIIAIFLNARGWQGLLIQASTFTLAHTITLGLAAAGLIHVDAGFVEPLIALSIAAVAIEALLVEKASPWRLPMIFGFGLFHGLGFGEQMKLYLTGADFGIGLGGFTIGVELGQLVILAACIVVSQGVKIGLDQAGKGSIYRNLLVRPVAILIALIGLYWFFQRLGVVPGGE
jgi:hydrogenase/urease accessory protein HupE